MRRIAQISDLHFGRHDEKIAADLLASIEAQRPDLVVMSGDFTQRARAAEFAEARVFLDAIAQPKLVVPGNHDLPLYDIVGRLKRPLNKFHRYITPAGVAGDLFEDPEIAVLGLNTARRFPGKTGRVSFQQIEELSHTFAKLPRSVFKILVTHHPLGYPENEKPHGVAGRSGHVLKRLAELNVHLLLSGHGHRPLSGAMRLEAIEHRSILVLHAGTAISTRTRGGHGNTYNQLDIDGDMVSIRIMQWSHGHGFEMRRKSDYHVAEGHWSPI
jgi:3',5'-cyclic AMP phosphodiesterase CpdA